VGRFEELLRLNNYRGAFAEALKERDPLKRIVLTVEVVSRSYREEFIPALLEMLNEVKGLKEKAVAESYVGRAFYALELEKEGEEHFGRAFEYLGRISSPMVQAGVLRIIGKNLVLSGRYSDGLRAFERAFDILQSGRALYSEVVSEMVRLAREIEKSAEEISNEKALDFYRLARGVYEALGFKLQAKEIDSKIELASEVFRRGSLAVTELLERGDAAAALQMARFLPPADRAIMMLNVSYWLLIHDMNDLARTVFEDATEMLLVGKFPASERELEAVAYKFIRIGKAKEALILAGLLKDERRASELLGEIAIFHARRGNVDEAMALANRIGDILIKDKVIGAIKEIRGVHKEQGNGG